MFDENNYEKPIEEMEQKNENENEFNSEYQTYSPYSGYYTPPTPPKPPKNKPKFSFKTLICCCLVCTVVSGGVSFATVKYLASQNSLTAGTGTTNTTINVDKKSTNAVSAIAEKAVPSVVGIKAVAQSNTYSWFGQSGNSTSEGSGVIYSSDGYIITNYHVISNVAKNSSQGKVSVYLSTDPNNAIDAKIIGYDEDYDLAVIKIEKTGLTAITFADSNDISVGDMAVAIGNPAGLEFMSSVSSGIISGLNRTIQLEGTAQMKLLQTDAAINPGNSGGALVNQSGELIGINSSKISSEEYEGMGFAIPSNTVKKQVNNIINNKDKKYAYLGVKISTEYTSEQLTSMGYPAGAVVESVDDNSPASEAGIQAYDIITSFDGVTITDYSSYNTERLKHKKGDKVVIKVYRNGSTLSGTVTLGESNN